MQGKGIVKFFLVALGLVSLIQFIYLIPTNSVENAADRYASSKCTDGTKTCLRTAKATYLDSVSSEPVASYWPFNSYTYQEMKGRQLSYGLDLKGGMSVLLQVDLRDFVRALANGGGADKAALDAALDKANQAQRTSQSDFVTLFTQAWKESSGGKPLNTLFKRNESLSSQINANTSDAEVTTVIRKKADETVGLTYELLKQRIDKLGVIGPNISLDAGRDLIVVELPGVDNPQRARSFLQAAAKLEFWNVYRVTDAGIMQSFIAANEKLKKMGNAPAPAPVTPAQDSVSTDTTGLSQVDTTQQNTPDTGIAAADTPAQDTTTPSLNATQQGPLFDAFTLNNGSFGLAPMGSADKNKRKAILEMLNRPGVRELFPRDVEFYWSRKPGKDAEGKQLDTYELYCIKKEPGKDAAPLEGDRVTDAFASPDPTTGEMAISLKMDQEGARIWGAMTQKAAQDNNREIAIVLDSTVVSAPRVINPILTGDSQITGAFTVQEANDLSGILQIGKLPARTQIIQESLVGPSLGAENISTSLKSLFAGFLMVLAFMVFYYAGGGVVSILVLLLNVVFIVGAVASQGVVLTLPGIAGIVLTIGMAVDANVIIFERIKEEIRAGKTLLVAIQEGYKHSYAAILDGNITTLLTAVVLFVFGLGPIKGFAVVLMIGILMTLFTAVLVSRLIIEWWVGKGKDLAFWTNATKDTFAHLNIDWMAKRKSFYVVSAVVTVLGLVSFFTRGFDLGVDFKGGYSFNVEFAQPTDDEAIRGALTTAFGKTPVVKAVDSENTYNIITDYLVADEAEDAPDRVMAKLHEGLKPMAGNADLAAFQDGDSDGTHVTSFSKVGPTVADDLRNSAWKAVIFGLLVIFLYILIRFSKWQYSTGAVIATVHDALMVVSLFSLLHGILPFSLEIDQAFIAAILTIIGYSVNDTVIVYDRIRENFSLHPNKDKHDIINMSINSTMSRTLLTSGTTLLTVLILFFVGSGSIKGFAFALVVGIVIGTYSSVFIASPIMADLSKGDIKITSRPSKDDKGGKKSSFSHHTPKAEA